MNEEEWEAFWRDGLEKEIAYYARRGDVAPLLEHLEQGNEIGEKLRAFLVDHFRGKTKRGPGGTPVKAQRARELDIANTVWMIARLGNEGKGMSLYAAQQEYLAKNTNMNLETLKSICKRWGVTGESVKKQ